MAEAKKMKATLEGGKWKWARPPGNGFSTAYFVCSGHTDCKRLLVIRLASDGKFYIYLKGEHASEPSFGKRKNSTLSWADDAKLRVGVDQGATPAAMRVSMTNEQLLELKDQGEDPMQHKNDEGGLQGAPLVHQRTLG